MKKVILSTLALFSLLATTAQELTYKTINHNSAPAVMVNMSDDVAYNLTKAYWDNKGKLGNAAKWWNGVSVKMLSNISTKIHPGAVKFYKEIGASLADHH